MLHVRHLSVRFGSFVALDDVSFRLQPGEIFGFLGPNGAGKTTTLKVLTGQIRPGAGEIDLLGRSLWDEFEGLRALFGYVPDFDNHLEDLTAEQNLSLFCRLYRSPDERIAEVLRRVELFGERDQKVRSFSKGMKKKLTIAREILHEPRLLYLDEPTANLDVHSTTVIRELLRELTRAGTAVFCTTHDMEEAEEICDRMAILDRGRIVEIDTPERFKRSYAEPRLRAVVETPEGERVCWFRMDEEDDRTALAERIRAGEVLSVQSHASSFKEVFLKLTGREFR